MALAPTLSHALSFARGGPSAWAEVCTPQGMKRVALDSAVEADAGAATPAPSMDHCPYCAFSADAAGLAPAPALVPTPPAGADALPALFLQAPHTLFAWASAQPRAPPVRS